MKHKKIVASADKISYPAISLIALFFILFLLASLAYSYWYFGGGKVEIVVVDPVEIDLSNDQIFPIESEIVIPVIYSNIPDLNKLPIDQKKQKFIEIFLPSILIAKHSLTQDYKKVEVIAQKIYPTRADQEFIKAMQIKYKTDDLSTLKSRLQTHPTSIVLAQAALESGWGTSRIFRDANNVFGVWSFNKLEPRIRAYNEREGGAIYLRRYDSVIDSIDDYFRTLGTSKAFKGFRDARLQSDNAHYLTNFLKQYSEQRGEYVAKLQAIIKSNGFERFDYYELNSSYLKLKAFH